MSPAGGASLYLPSRFPRVSGDEPMAKKKIDMVTLFSPRERG